MAVNNNNPGLPQSGQTAGLTAQAYSGGGASAGPNAALVAQSAAPGGGQAGNIAPNRFGGAMNNANNANNAQAILGNIIDNTFTGFNFGTFTEEIQV